MKVLCLDDDPEFLQLFEKYLEGTDIEYETALSTEDFLNIISTRFLPDVFVVDCRINQKLEGIDVIQKLKELPMCKDIPIMSISGFQDRNYINTILSIGADDYLSKPFSKDELHSRLSLLSNDFENSKMAFDEVQLKKKEKIEINFNLVLQKYNYQTFTFLSKSYIEPGSQFTLSGFHLSRMGIYRDLEFEVGAIKECDGEYIISAPVTEKNVFLTSKFRAEKFKLAKNFIQEREKVS